MSSVHASRLEGKLLLPVLQSEPRGSDRPAGKGASSASMKPAVANWGRDGPVHSLGPRAQSSQRQYALHSQTLRKLMQLGTLCSCSGRTDRLMYKMMTRP